MILMDVSVGFIILHFSFFLCFPFMDQPKCVQFCTICCFVQRDTGLDEEQVESLRKAFEDEVKRKDMDNCVNATSVGVILKVGSFYEVGQFTNMKNYQVLGVRVDNNVLEDALDELEHDDEVNHDYI